MSAPHTRGVGSSLDTCGVSPAVAAASSIVRCLLVGALALSGCRQLLSDVELESYLESQQRREQYVPAELVSFPLLPSEPGGSDQCAASSVRCVGPALQVCSDEGGGWVTVEVCASNSLCRTDGSQCAAPACSFGQVRCNVERLELCNSERTGFQLLEQCVGSAYCSSKENRCRDNSCVAGELQCSDGALQECLGEEEGWGLKEQCASQSLCEKSLVADANAGQCITAVCSFGERRCDGARLELCNLDQTGWTVLDTCGSEALCDRASPVCSPSACGVGEVRCDATGALQRCELSRGGFETEQQCLSSAFCSVTVGSEACAEQPCTEDNFRCNGAQIERCGTDRVGFEAFGSPCATASLCSINAGENGPRAVCRAPACVTNQYQCVGKQLARCSDDRTEFVPSEECESAALCNAVLQRCEPARCDVGEIRCTGAELEVCNSGRTDFQVVDTCQSAAKCDAVGGACVGSCVVGSTRCNGSVLEECRDSVLGWQQLAFCQSAGLCNAAANQCEPVACRPGEKRCQDGDLQACTVGLSGFELFEACASTEICDATGGQCDVCVPEQTSCVGDVLTRCSQDGQSLSEVRQCGANLCRADAASARCLECVPNTQRCDGAVIRGCDAQGQESEISRCETAALCSVMGLTAACASPACALGQVECAAGGEVLACEFSRTAFASQSPVFECPAGTECDANQPGGCGPAPGDPAVDPIPSLVAGLPAFEFTTVLNSSSRVLRGLGPLVVDVPSEWVDVDSTPWLDSNGFVLGPSLVAATDVGVFNQGFGASGMSITASNMFEGNVRVALESTNLATACTVRESRGDFNDNGHAGVFEVWRGCGGTGAAAFAVAATPPGADYVVVLLVKMLASRDQDAVDQIVSTFIVGN